jgi:3-methyladenine DNA glycosylase/8-oxoguanine DNA glycosylase
LSYVEKLRVSWNFATKVSSLSYVEKLRAAWNSTLEKTLVDLLHEHKTADYRGQNGWTTEAWNKIVKEFHQREQYVYFTKTQIQDKERELKRDYRLLKDAKNQSGAHFDEKTGRITADPALWKKYTDFSS